MNDEENYQRKVEYLKEKLKQAQAELEKTEEQFKNLDSLEGYNDKQKFYLRISILPNQISKYKNIVDSLEKKIEFMRPDTKEDIEYRKRILNEYNEKICDTIPEDLHLLFHGTSIYSARDIINAGKITSPGERGIESDITSPGAIWVTSKHSAMGIATTLDYAGLGTSEECMPAGCVFVLNTDKENEEKCGKSLSTSSFSFKEDQNKLFSIITTPENIKRVKEWCEEKNIDINKVSDYDSFLEILQNKEYIKNNSLKEEKEMNKDEEEQIIE